MKTIRIDELIAPQETLLGREDKICQDIFWPGFVYDRGADAGRDPFVQGSDAGALKADDTSIIASGFTRALGGTLMTFLIRPGKREALAKPEKENAGHELLRRPLRTIHGTRMPARKRGAGSRGSEKASLTDVSGTQGRAKAGT